MARINIEEKLLLDIRFKALSRKMGEYAAIGAWVTVAFVAQRYWGDGQQLIPLDIWELGGLPNEMVDCHLVEKRPEGYYLKGSEVYFAWYESRCQLAKKGRDRIKSKKAEIAEKSNIRPNIESNIRPSESLILDLVDGNTTSPPTPTPTPTPIKEYIYTKTQLRSEGFMEILPQIDAYALPTAARMTKEGLLGIIEKWGVVDTKYQIENVHNYIEATGKKYKSIDAAVRSFLRKEEKEKEKRERATNRKYDSSGKIPIRGIDTQVQDTLDITIPT